MIHVYVVENSENDSVYFGMTSRSVETRLKDHIRNANRGGTSPFHKAISEIGPEKFSVLELKTVEDREIAGKLEKGLIATYKETNNVYNVLPGGDGAGFYITDKEAWKDKLKAARIGKQPALGMKHSDETKANAAKVSRAYWDTQETYNPDDIVGLSHKEAKDKLGISTTHYYRLKKLLAESNELS